MSSQHKILTLKNALSLASEWQKSGEKIVFTNGCFDIIHAGHIKLLEAAKSKGDKLIVALNTDASIRKIKGINRPVNGQDSRGIVIAAMGCVDLVIFFDEDTPIDLIKSLSPDILVKGSDYKISNIVGADFVIANGGTVETISLVNNYSTTSIINRIVNN